MTAYIPIDCHLHDSIEVACLYGYSLRVALHDAEIIEGVAKTWLTDPHKSEYLILKQGGEIRIRLDRIKSIDVLTPNAAFKHLNF